MKERCEACRETRARFSRPETQKARKSGLHREHHPATDLDLFFRCPGENSVTQARPQLRLQAQPFESPRKVRRHFASWAE